jgi:hypothetical protein
MRLSVSIEDGDITEIDVREIVKQFGIDVILREIGAVEAMNYFGEDEALSHFGITKAEEVAPIMSSFDGFISCLSNRRIRL